VSRKGSRRPMDKDFTYPILISPVAMFVIFAICLLAFHLVLVKLWPLGKRGWKKVDYIWLAVAGLGILGTAGAMRRQIATSFAKTAEIRARSSYDFARYQMTSLAGPAVCLTFTKSDFSPRNLDEIQVEYNRVCEFGRGVLNKVPSEMPKESGFPDFGKWPEVKDGILKEIFSEIEQAIDRYRVARNNLEALRKDAEYSSLDDNLLFLSPFLFAVALALRITKVTGELRAES
jgi:hypothetical protein